MAPSYSHEAFAAQLHTMFQLATSGAPLPLELVEVSPLRHTGEYDSFTLVLRGPPNQYIPQASYRFEHDAIGPLDIFIVPIHQDQQGLYYEANFNYQRAEVAA